MGERCTGEGRACCIECVAGMTLTCKWWFVGWGHMEQRIAGLQESGANSYTYVDVVQTCM